MKTYARRKARLSRKYMLRKKLTKKERIFDPVKENEKDLIAYDCVKLYAETDIPIPEKSQFVDGGILTPKKIWQDFDPTEERFDGKLVFSENNLTVYSFCAAHCPDGDLTVQLSVYAPSYDSPKGVILIGDNSRVPQKSVIDDIVGRGSYVFIADYNGVSENTLTVFPPSLSYGKSGNEGKHLTELSPTAKETCAYLYTLIHRRALGFIEETYGKKCVIALGIKRGVEIAMQLAGTEKTRITALACVGASGYPEYAGIPRYPVGASTLPDDVLAFIAGASGVSYLKGYPHPVFAAVGSNGTISDVDRLSSLKNLISGPLTVSISQEFSDNVDKETWKVCLDFLDSSFWKSDFPLPPVSSVKVNRDGSVYADITASIRPKIKFLSFYYSYNNIDHRTRTWEKVACETVGEGQYLAKLSFSTQCSTLFFYTETVYENGLISTEPPKFADLSAYRIMLSAPQSATVLYRHGAEGEFLPVSEDAVVGRETILEKTLPSGAKGAVCPDGSMKLFVGDSCRLIENGKLLQADTFRNEPYYQLELSVSCGFPATVYRASKRIMGGATFNGTTFACSDFKDEFFRPLPSWKEVNTFVVVTPDVTVNKLTFI